MNASELGTLKDRIKNLLGIIMREAHNELLDPLLIAAICWRESKLDSLAFRFEPGFQAQYVLPLSIEKIHAQNPAMKSEGTPSERTERTALATSWGAMQIMGQTARELGFRGQYLTELCGELGIVYGVRYLSEKIKIYKNDGDAALSAYNAGSKTKSNENYVDSVNERYNILRGESEISKWFV